MSTADNPDLRNSVRHWMSSVMGQFGWTPERWARLADVPPSAITRVMRMERATLPSLGMLARLAEAANTPFGLIVDQDAQVGIPRLERADLERLAALYDEDLRDELDRLRRDRSRRVFTVGPEYRHCLATDWIDDGLALAGVPAGSTVIIDPEAPIERGDPVALVGAPVQLRLVQGSSLVSRAMQLHPLLPREQARILGRVAKVKSRAN